MVKKKRTVLLSVELYKTWGSTTAFHPSGISLEGWFYHNENDSHLYYILMPGVVLLCIHYIAYNVILDLQMKKMRQRKVK